MELLDRKSKWTAGLKGKRVRGEVELRRGGGNGGRSGGAEEVEVSEGAGERGGMGSC